MRSSFGEKNITKLYLKKKESSVFLKPGPGIVPDVQLPIIEGPASPES